MLIEIPVHSITSLITNSSTTIYTKSENCEEAFRKMVEELFVSFNIPLKFDDVFQVVLLSSSSWRYSDYAKYKKVEGVDENTNFDKLYDDVKTGKMPKPTWFYFVEQNDPGSTNLFISTKDPKYDKLAETIESFLYSTSYEEGEN
jgi:hypothetical protein